MDNFSHHHSKQTNVHLRSRSLGKRNFKLTKKHQQKMELKQQVSDFFDLDETHPTSDIDNTEERVTLKKAANFQFGKHNDYNVIFSSHGRIIQRNPMDQKEGGGNSPQTQTQQQQSTQQKVSSQQQQQGSQSLPLSSISSLKSRDPQFSLDPFDMKGSFEEDFGTNFFEDSLQLQALFYQLSKHDFQTTPLTECSPILAQNDQMKLLRLISQEDSGMQQLAKVIKYSQESSNIVHFFQQLDGAGEGFITESIQYVFDQLNSSNRIKQNFNYQIAIDDFLMYQSLYKEQEQSIIQQLKENKYGKNNLCIGYVRFVFQEITQKSEFNIRIPIGKFEQNMVVNVESFKILTPDTLKDFGLRKFTNLDSTATHSEKLLLLWIVENQDYFSSDLKQKLEDQFNCQFQAIPQLQLNQVYVEITSEKKVCQTCLNKFCQFPSKLISYDIVNKIKSDLFTVQVHNDFQLIIATQYLFDPEYRKENKGFSLYCEAQDGTGVFPKNNSIFYIETNCIGQMTNAYLEKRFAEKHNNQSLFTQRIDSIKPTNTFFLSQLINTSKSGSQQAVQSQQNQVKQNRLLNADVYHELTQTISQITWINSQKPQQQKEANIQQKRTLFCFQLLQIMIKKQISHKDLLYLISPDYLKILLFQVLILEPLNELFELIEFLNNLFFQSQIEKVLTKKNFSILHKKIFKIKNMFDFGMLNTKLLLQDYYFMLTYCSNQLLENLQINQEQLNLTLNFGLVKLNLSLQDQNYQVREEILDIQMGNINSNFFEELTKQLQFKQQKLSQNGVLITQIDFLTVTVQQLSKEYKKWMESKLNLGIQIQYYYSYFRKLLPLSKENYKNEEQYLIYDIRNLETRYSKENADYQMPLNNMDESLSVKLFDYESFQQSQQIEQEIQ